MRKIITATFYVLFLFTVSCGIEDYLYLIPVSEGGINISVPNTTATVILPDIPDQYYYFTHFSLFYRIYVSDVNITTTYPYQSSVLSSINSTLASDFSTLSYYTSITTNVITNLGSQFSSRKYYAVELREAAVENVLSSSVIRDQIELDFSTGKAPELTVRPSTAYERKYTLRRTGGEGIFRPVPADRLFFNTDDLNSGANAVATINNDVANKTSATGQRHTYVSIYIVTTGRDSNYTPIYSRPTHVGIFSLPDAVTGSP